MGLRLKFNFVLFFVFAAGIAASSYISHRLLQESAKQEVLRDAGLMMEAASSIRGYTVQQVEPHLKSQLAKNFLPQTVPAYAATETFNDEDRNTTHGPGGRCPSARVSASFLEGLLEAKRCRSYLKIMPGKGSRTLTGSYPSEGASSHL